MMDLFVKWLAVLGGAVLGGWLVGWAIGFVGRGWFKDHKFPAFVAWAVRLMGAVLAGLLTFYLVFGGGGSGLGGTGGWGAGTKDAKKDGKDLPKVDNRPKPKDQDNPKEPANLRVEVLSAHVLKRLAGDKAINQTKCYRLSRDSEPVALEDVKKAIKAGLDAKPKLTHVEIILYFKDSPKEELDVVQKLKEMARDMDDGLSVDVSKRKDKAP